VPPVFAAVRGQRLNTVRAQIRQGDAFDLITDVPDSSVDLLLTSPPYWGLRSYGLPLHADVLQKWRAAGCPPSRIPPYEWYQSAGGVLGLEPYPSWYVEHLVEFFNRARRTLTPSGSLWVNLGDTYFARWSSIRDGGRQGYEGQRVRRRTPVGGYLQDKQLLLIPARFAIAMQDAGWILRNDLIWVKPKVLPRPEQDRLRLTHEHWFHFVLRPSRRRATYYYDLNGCEKGAQDVVTCPTVPGNNGHTAAFPPDLIRPRIVSSCPADGLLLDPFCGTGRAILEAVQLGRRGLGFDISPPYATAAKKCLSRALAKVDADLPLGGSDLGVIEAPAEPRL
jgi:site-specific DNA-methyltransferase (cytosine-N4-specific)